jgi:hypothetical protein
MGVNDEYSRDAYTGDHYVYDSDSSDEFDSQLDPEDWQDIYSQELLNGWMTIKYWLETQYLPVRTTYHDFVQFVLTPSRWYTEDPPSSTCLLIWDEISKIDVISERVEIGHFTGWFKYNVE